LRHFRTKFQAIFPSLSTGNDGKFCWESLQIPSGNKCWVVIEFLELLEVGEIRTQDLTYRLYPLRLPAEQLFHFQPEKHKFQRKKTVTFIEIRTQDLWVYSQHYSVGDHLLDCL
jgi:hypothetical protein